MSDVAQPLREESRRLLNLAWPIALTQLQWIILNVIDVAMVGHASTQELAYFSAGRMGNWVALIVGISALSGVQVFTARADGAGDKAACGSVFRQGVLLALVMGFGMAIPTLLFARIMLGAAGVPPALADGGATVLQVMALNFPGSFLLVAASLYLEGLSRPRVALMTVLLTLPLNIVANGFLVFGWWGAPQLGAAGAALGTLFANTVGVAILLVYIRVTRPQDCRGWRTAWREGQELRQFGLAPGVASGLENMGFAVLIALSTRVGAATAGAFQAMLSVHVLTMTLSTGLASAAAVRIGNAIGAGEPHEIARRGWLAAGLTVSVTLLWGVIYLSFAPQLAAPSSPDPAVITATVAMLGMMAWFLWADGVQMVMVFSLRAAGDQVAAGVIQVTSYFAVMSLAGWFLVGPMGGAGLALAMGLGLATAAVAGSLRFGWITRTGSGLSGRITP